LQGDDGNPDVESKHMEGIFNRLACCVVAVSGVRGHEGGSLGIGGKEWQILGVGGGGGRRGVGTKLPVPAKQRTRLQSI